MKTSSTLCNGSSLTGWRAALGACLAFVTLNAHAFQGLNVTELPPGGDVTVPGDYPIQVPQRIDALFTGSSTPQTMTLTTQSRTGSVVHIFAKHEKSVRKIRISPGSSAVYSLKQERPVRVKVIEGDVRVNSIMPLKVQR
jgi:hypothetical protein